MSVERDLALLLQARAQCPSKMLFDSVILGDNWDFRKPTHLIDWSATAFWDLYRPEHDNLDDYSVFHG